MFKKIINFASLHKVIAGLVVAGLAGGIYFGYKAIRGNSSAPTYVLAQVHKGTIVSSITGSGQVSVTNQIEIKPKVSGDVVYVEVDNGQYVNSGTLLLELDITDAQKAVRDAEVSLESAKLTLERLKGPEGAAVTRAKETANYDLKKAYDDGFNAVASVFVDLPSTMSGLQSILYSYDLNASQNNLNFYVDAVKNYDEKIITYAAGADSSYQSARKQYDKNFDDYKNINRASDQSAIDSLVNETYNTELGVAEALKNINNVIQFYEDRLSEHNKTPAALAGTHVTSINSYSDKTNAHLTSLLSIENNIKTAHDEILNADIDVASQELSVKQRENALSDAKEKLADYYIRAPFDGIVAKVNVKKGDSISSASAVTFITKQRTAEISLNEVDAAKIKIGEKTTLTFDAVPDLSLVGEVSEIDTVGSVTQGVVTYNVKIVFATQDERVKPGMSVSAAIITNVKQDILTVPNSAVKSQGNIHYVEIGSDVSTPPTQQTVEIGVSNDDSTEIVSGLKEGDQIVTRTVANQAKPATVSAPSLFGGGGGGNRIR